jgi:hypothetical protein
VFRAILADTLEVLRVPDRERREIINIAESLRADIVQGWLSKGGSGLLPVGEMAVTRRGRITGSSNFRSSCPRLASLAAAADRERWAPR